MVLRSRLILWWVRWQSGASHAGSRRWVFEWIGYMLCAGMARCRARSSRSLLNVSQLPLPMIGNRVKAQRPPTSPQTVQVESETNRYMHTENAS